MCLIDAAVILKPHLLFPLIGLALGQGVLDTVGSTVGSTLDTAGSTVGSTLDTVGSSLDTLGNSLDTGVGNTLTGVDDTLAGVDDALNGSVNLDTGAALGTDLSIDPSGLNLGVGGAVDSSAGVSAAGADTPSIAAAGTAPAGWKYNGCLATFPTPPWITYTPADAGTMTAELCTTSCRPYRAATGGQIYAVVYSNPGERDYCYCTGASADPLAQDGCFAASCAQGVTGQCSAEGKAIVYSVGPGGAQVRLCFCSVVEVFDVKLCFVCNQCKDEGSSFGGWGSGVLRDGGREWVGLGEWKLFATESGYFGDVM